MKSYVTAVKEAIVQELDNDFERYVNLNLLKEEAFNFLKSELELKYWEHGFYFTRNASILEAQKKLWEKIEEFAEKHNLDPDALWKNKVVDYVYAFDHVIEKVLEENGFKEELAKRLAEHLVVGYGDREGGFLVAINPKAVDSLLNPNLESVVKEFLKRLPKESLKKLKKALSKSEKAFTETLEEILTKEEDLLIWLYIEQSKDLQNFIKAVRDLCEYLTLCLLDLSTNIELWVN